MARPRKEIDEKTIEKLAALQCTYEEMAGFFGVDKTTISRRFATVIEQARQGGRCSLRRKQWLACRAGNVSMLKWLGMQWLGQSERQNVTQQVSVTARAEEMSDDELAAIASAGSGGNTTEEESPAEPAGVHAIHEAGLHSELPPSAIG
jgi:hypothetical protein